ASIGLAADAKLDTTVMPFIIRGVSLLGIASAGTGRDIREAIWQHLASDWQPARLDKILSREVALDELPGVLMRCSRADRSAARWYESRTQAHRIDFPICRQHTET